jgi:hypothetical protein
MNEPLLGEGAQDRGRDEEPHPEAVAVNNGRRVDWVLQESPVSAGQANPPCPSCYR